MDAQRQPGHQQMVAAQDTWTSAFPSNPSAGVWPRECLAGMPWQKEMGCGSSSGKNYSLRTALVIFVSIHWFSKEII